ERLSAKNFRIAGCPTGTGVTPPAQIAIAMLPAKPAAEGAKAYAESDIIILLLTYQIDNGGLKLSQVTTTRNLAILSPMRGT
ncbi:hypothetical protein, partial [Streptococcus pneumoniae]|uniref:hypothetical protein n=1 Tax=Streptococcus pneumoniae TaxID=1313 RepID=UPI0013DD70E3